MSTARHTDEGELSRRQFVKESALAYWTAAGAAGSGMLALPWPGIAQEGSGPVDCGPPPRAKPQSRTGGESFPPLPLPATPLRRSEKKRPPAPPALDRQDGDGPDPVGPQGRQAGPVPRLDDRSGRRVTACWPGPPRSWASTTARPRPTSTTSRSIRASCRPCSSPGTTSSSLTDDDPREAGPLRDGRRHDHRRRLLRLERFRRRRSAARSS